MSSHRSAEICARALALAAIAFAVGCTTLSNGDGARLRDAETVLAQNKGGQPPSNDEHVAYCQIHCVLLSSGQIADPSGEKLACPPCSNGRPNPAMSPAATEIKGYRGVE